MDERKLYPMKFCSLQDEYVWGSEKFELADLGYRDSLVKEGWLAGNLLSDVMDTYLDRVVGDLSYETYGRQFPFCVRRLNVTGKMPLRVHPDDETAFQRFDMLGKEKLWYIVKAGKDARIYLGFKDDCDAGQLMAGVEDGSVVNLLNTVVPFAGQSFLIEPGTIHGAEGELGIVEISQSSPVDICVYNFGNELGKEEFEDTLTLVDALDFINYKAFKADKDKGENFIVNHFELPSAMEISSEALDSFVIYTPVEGALSVQLEVLGQTAEFSCAAGESILIPAECEGYVLVPLLKGTHILETTIVKS